MHDRWAARSVTSLSVVVACAAACSFPDFQADEVAPPLDTGVAGDTATTDGSSDTRTSDTGTTIDSSADATEAEADAGACGADPTLHPPSSFAGPYCPFLSDAATGSSCSFGQICCEYPVGTPSTCTDHAPCPALSAMPSSWECDAPVQCHGAGASGICCGNGAPTVRPGCGYEEVRPPQGTVCAASCGAGQFIVCEQASDCPTGRTCTPIKSAGRQFGYCQ